MSEKRHFTSLVVQPVTTTIESGNTESDVINLQGTTLKTIILPAAFSGTKLTFKISPDNVTYYTYRNIDNVEVGITCSQNNAYGLGAIDFYSIQWMKIVSNISEAADREITLLLRGL